MGVTDYRAKLAELLDGVDLDLNPEQEREAQVQALASDRAHTGEPEGLQRKLIEPIAPAESALTGEFTARISDTLPDHQNERFTKFGFETAVRRLRESGRALPVLFGHNQEHVHNVIGMIPADGLSVNDEDQLIARGWLDVTDSLGKKIHRMLRAGALRWSIGGWWNSAKQEGKTRVLELREVAELSAVPIPANPRTATTSIKGVEPSDLSPDQLRDWAEAAGVLPPAKPPSAAALEAKRQRMLRDLGMDEASVRRNTELRKAADYATMEVALGEPVEAARKRERADAELRRKVDELRLEAAVDFDLNAVKGAGDVGPHAREKLRALIRYYMVKAHPWAACVRDNSQRFGPEGAKKVCAVLKDLGEGTTRWRKADTSKRDYVAELWTAADGNLSTLMSMWRDWILANGDDPKEHMGQDGLTAAWGMGPKSFDSLAGPGPSKRIGERERSVKDLMMRLMMGEE
jgi:Caudovirus prohead serine protease